MREFPSPDGPIYATDPIGGYVDPPYFPPPVPVTRGPSREDEVEDIASEIEAHADTATRPGQYGDLLALAQRVRALAPHLFPGEAM